MPSRKNQMAHSDPGLKLETSRLLMSLPEPAAASSIALFERANFEHLSRWNPPLPQALETDFWTLQLEQNRREFAEMKSLRLFLYLKDEAQAEVAGFVNLNDIRLGVRRTASLAFGLGADREGQGLAAEALRAVVQYAFSHLELHRLEAAFVPGNTRCEQLLRRLDFQVEGRLRESLLLHGTWFDTILAARINVEACPA